MSGCTEAVSGLMTGSLLCCFACSLQAPATHACPWLEQGQRCNSGPNIIEMALARTSSECWQDIFECTTVLWLRSHTWTLKRKRRMAGEIACSLRATYYHTSLVTRCHIEKCTPHARRHCPQAHHRDRPALTPLFKPHTLFRIRMKPSRDLLCDISAASHHSAQTWNGKGPLSR